MTSHCRSLQDTDYSGLCQEAGARGLSLGFRGVPVNPALLSPPAPPLRLVTTSLFSPSVGLFLFCKHIRLCYFQTPPLSDTTDIASNHTREVPQQRPAASRHIQAVTGPGLLPREPIPPLLLCLLAPTQALPVPNGDCAAIRPPPSPALGEDPGLPPRARSHRCPGLPPTRNPVQAGPGKHPKEEAHHFPASRPRRANCVCTRGGQPLPAPPPLPAIAVPVVQPPVTTKPA